MTTAVDSTVDPARAAESHGPRILAVSAIVHFLALIVVALRSYTRIVMVHSFGARDIIMIVTAMCALGGGMIPLFLQGSHGLGHHSDTLAPSDLVAISQYSFIQSLVAHMGGIGFLKIAIALELLKLKSAAWKWYTIILWSMIAFVCAYTVLAWLSFLLYCRPIEKSWDSTVAGECYSVALFIKFGLVNTSFNIFTDVVFATLPVPIIWTLKMNLRARIYLIAVLSLGYLAVAMGIIKAFYQISFDPFADTTFDYDIQFWGLLQLNVGIIAACAPSLKPLVVNVLKLKSQNSSNKYGYGYSNSRNNNSRRTGRGTGILSASRGYTKQDSRNEDFDLVERMPERENHGYTATARARDPGAGSQHYQDGAVSFREGSGSQDSILGLDNAKNKGIVRTTEVSISY